jgi:hypothetical protein
MDEGFYIAGTAATEFKPLLKNPQNEMRSNNGVENGGQRTGSWPQSRDVRSSTGYLFVGISGENLATVI